MKARQLLDGASFNPDQLRVVLQAFDAAWENISPTVSANAIAVEASRLNLAKAVLAVAKQGPIEAERIKDDALKVMFSESPELGSPPPGRSENSY